MELREIQRPIKARYRDQPDEARITVTGKGLSANSPMSCSVDLGRAVYAAQAHAGVGGSGVAPCSGDLLVGALAACAQITCQMVAANMGISIERIEVRTEGDLDLRGTLGLSDEVPVGFGAIRVWIDIVAPEAQPDRLDALRARTERYCVVLQTLLRPPAVEVRWSE